MKDRFKELRDRVGVLSRLGRVTVRAYVALAGVVLRERLWAVPRRGEAR